MASQTVTLKVHVAWWVPLYLRTLALMCWTMGTEPDMDIVWRVVRRGIRLHEMKLTTLKPKVNQAPSRIPMLNQRPGATPRLRGRAAVDRRERWLMDNPYCVECKKEGRIVAATVPDHIEPLWKGGADDESNLQSLCRAHHDEKSAREAAERARGG